MVFRRNQLTALWLGVVVGFATACSQASAVGYVFRGHFEATNLASSAEWVYSTPSELLGREFTIEITWPTSASEYSSDWQTGSNGWGSYTTQAITVSIEVAGLDFDAPPVIFNWETRNDTAGGDELTLVGRANWMQTFFGTVTIEDQYLLSLRAADFSGLIFDDDSLQAVFDLTTFDDVWFEFLEVVPVASSDPRPIRYNHWLGVVDSLAVVPEPASYWLALLALAGFAVAACRRHRPTPLPHER